MKNNLKILSSLILLVIIGVSFVSAFSVSAPYMENKILTMPLDPGTTDLQFVLQNGGGSTEIISVKVSVVKGSTITSIMDQSDTYTVNPGDKVPVNVKIDLPEDAKAGYRYEVVLSFATVTQSSSGEFGFGTGQEQRFTALVVSNEMPEDERNSALDRVIPFLVAGLLLLIVLIVIFSKKKKK